MPSTPISKMRINKMYEQTVIEAGWHHGDDRDWQVERIARPLKIGGHLHVAIKGFRGGSERNNNVAFRRAGRSHRGRRRHPLQTVPGECPQVRPRMGGRCGDAAASRRTDLARRLRATAALPGPNLTQRI
jgi:hypothetical protein